MLRQIAILITARNERRDNMAITVWGRRTSSNVQKVIWTLGELELPFEHVVVGGFAKGTDTPDYRAMNPNGLVPTIRDGDLVLWESHAIVRYLSAEYGSGLLFPVEARERAIVDQWTDWTATTFQPAWGAVFLAKVRTPEADRKPDAIARAIAQAEKQFEILDRRLADVPYLAGEQLTYADLVAGIGLYRWTSMDIPRSTFAKVAAWHQRLRERPAYVRAVEVPYDELVGRLTF
jgi:glutathione S-transferase